MTKKVKFTLSIGYYGANHEETFSFKELGITDDMTQEEIEEFLTKEHIEWRYNYLDGGWSIEED
ncbi:hypothetical protein [Bacillus sp. JCM 19041]|uniref:DUF7167 family protein n=1 Tax=Bacillus sp. JCM 19041 TaxID=1460637 RepID=UPI0006D10E85